MKRLIIVDTTSTIGIEEAKQNGFELIPLAVSLDGKSYLDQFEISGDQLAQALENHKLPTTSQPSLGLVTEMFERVKLENYDHIYALALSSGLSGTYQNYELAKKTVGLDNLTVIDTKTVGAPIRELAYAIKAKLEANASHEDILDLVGKHIEDTYSFLYPTDLKHLKRGGRMSPLAYGLASLLKIKPLLMLKKDGSTVEKFDVFRTEKKLYSTVFEQFKTFGMNATKHKLTILHAFTQEKLNELIGLVQEHLPGVEYECRALPAVLLCHAGLDSVALQMAIKEKASLGSFYFMTWILS